MLLKTQRQQKRKSSLSAIDPIQISRKSVLHLRANSAELSQKYDVICTKGVDPSFEKVREVTLQREQDRQRQLQQIQVDRQIQNSKDLEAMEKFRRTFFAKGTSIHPEKPPPMGIDRDKRFPHRADIQFD